MIDFTLSDEEVDWQQFVKKFVKENLLNRDDLDTHGYFPRELYQKAYDCGLMTSMIPKEYGGGGRTLFESVLAAEECSYGDLGFTTSAFLSRLSLAPLLLFGSKDQKNKWLSLMTSNMHFSSFCFTEPEGSTNLGTRPATTIAKIVDGGFIINGSKWTITNGSVASLYTVFARMDGDESGLNCFLIPRDTAGITITKSHKKMGQRASDTAQVEFKEVFIAKENMIGKHGQGAQIALKSLRHSRVGVGAMSLGVSQRARDLALAHCHKRLNGEGTPIVYEQDIKFRFALIDAKIEMLRSFVYKAVYELEKDKFGTKFSSAVKLMGAKIAFEITNECLELHGGQGYLEEGLIEKLVRDANLLRIYEGTEAVQKLLIADTAIRLKKDRL